MFGITKRTLTSTSPFQIKHWKIKSINKEGAALDKIAKEVQKTTKLETELIKYITQAGIVA